MWGREDIKLLQMLQCGRSVDVHDWSRGVLMGLHDDVWHGWLGRRGLRGVGVLSGRLPAGAVSGAVVLEMLWAEVCSFRGAVFGAGAEMEAMQM